MGLAATLEKGAPPDMRKRCGVALWLDSLDPADRAAFDATVPLAEEQADGWNVSKLWRVCVAEGFTLQRDKFAKHLKGECACGPR